MTISDATPYGEVNARYVPEIVNVSHCSACGQDHYSLPVYVDSPYKAIHGDPNEQFVICPLRDVRVYIRRVEA
jgi:hypothetical protein